MMLKRSFGGEDQFSGEEEDAAENGKVESPRPSSELSKPFSPNHPADPGIRKLQVLPTMVINERSSSIDASSRPSCSNLKNSAAINKDQVLESAKAEMGHVREENQRLKTVLARILKDYQSLQMQFYDINVQQEQQAKKSSTVSSASTDRDDEEADLVVSLSLGTTSSVPKRELEKVVLDMNSRKCNDEEEEEEEDGDHDNLKQGLSLGLDCKFQDSNSTTAAAAGGGALMEPPSSTQSPDKSFEGAKDEEMGEAWPPSRILKTVRSTSGNDEMSQQSHVKKTRVSVRTRCESPTMNDGCQWRKYGQKIAKGNPCPRAYYRCTVSPGCPVRKQVQRCSEDMSILITTYEGTHNHPLPISATAMASTTSAAACMLMAGSSSSSAAFRNSINGTTSADLHGLNYFNSSDTSRTRPPFYISNHPIFSSSNSHPTVTLDLTAPPSNYNRSFSSNFPSTATTRIFPSTGFNFSSSSEPNAVPTPWGNPGGGYLSSGSTIHQPYNRTQFGSTFHAQPQELRYQPQLQRSNSGPPPQPPMSEVIAAATKVITSDPSFQSALAAAITSVVGNNGGGESFGHGHKWGGGQQIQGITSGTYSSGPAPSKGSGCAPTNYLTCSSSSSSPPHGNLLFLPPLPLSTSKSTSASPVDKREHMN